MIAKVLAIAAPVLAVLAVFSVHVGKFSTVRELPLASTASPSRSLSAGDAGKGSCQSYFACERNGGPSHRIGKGALRPDSRALYHQSIQAHDRTRRMPRGLARATPSEQALPERRGERLPFGER